MKLLQFFHTKFSVLNLPIIQKPNVNKIVIPKIEISNIKHEEIIDPTENNNFKYD
jgi:hypothetical protein